MNAEGTWHKEAWSDWCRRTPDHWSSSNSLTPQAYSWTWHICERHSPWSNQGSPQWNSSVDTTSNDPRQYGDGRGQVIPSFDGTDFRQYERRARLFVSNTRVAPERRAGKLVERLEGRAFDSCEGMQDLETPNGVENLLHHWRTHFEPIEVFRRGRIVDDFVYDWDRQPDEEIRDYHTTFNFLTRRFEAVAGQANPLIKAHVFLRKANLSAEKQSQIVSAAMSRYEHEPLGDAMLTASPRAGALRAGVPLHRKQSGAYSAQVVEAQDEKDEGERVLEAKEACELEADKARRFFRKPQSPQERKPGSTSLSRNFHV